MGYYWDNFTLENQIADEYDISDLSEKQILNAVRMGVRGGRMPESALSLSTEDILKRLSLLKDGKPIQAAVALFCDKLHYTPQLKLRMARFKGINKNEFVDSQNASGCFFDLLDAGMSFCFKHLNLHGKVIGLHRVEDLDIPVEALREALINALCHRSYESISGSVSLAIYDDRVEIENPGRLPLDITPDNIKESHDSKPYNPTIAGVLYKPHGWRVGVAVWRVWFRHARQKIFQNHITRSVQEELPSYSVLRTSTTKVIPIKIASWIASWIAS